MIKFEMVRWKNFMSTGDSWTEVDLVKNKSTLIVGQNGSGKSTMLDAMSFALFGKPHRNIKKGQLVNTINNKDCLVELTFKIGTDSHKVVRGIKPNVFEIWKNGTMINQSSHAKEYQNILEQNIIKLNHKSFHQIVVLGSSSFIPFMKLPALHRREVIEDLLDINVFSVMNGIIKQKSSVIKETIKDITYNLDLVKQKIDSQKKYIRDITQINDEEINSKRTQITDIETEIHELQETNAEASAYIERESDQAESNLKSSQEKLQTLSQYKAEFNTSVKALVKDAKFYEENSECPTCEQVIAEEVREAKLKESTTRAKTLNSGIQKVDLETDAIKELIATQTSLVNTIREKQSLINNNNQTIKLLHSSILSVNQDINRIMSREGDLGNANSELNAMNDTRTDLADEKMGLNEELSYHAAMSEMLKDTGIKTKIMKQYIPVINKLVNDYLQILDFFVHFTLDESFVETIRSRHRDAFSYDSFSEGEKQRIDLSLLFTWRQIAKMKNSVATNLLVLDETFDSSLDHDGVENLMKILHSLDDDTNVFVISHKGEILENKFDNKLEFYKQKDFSKCQDFSLQAA